MKELRPNLHLQFTNLLAHRLLAWTAAPAAQGQEQADSTITELHALVADAREGAKQWRQEALDLAQQLAASLSAVSAQGFFWQLE